MISNKDLQTRNFGYAGFFCSLVILCFLILLNHSYIYARNNNQDKLPGRVIYKDYIFKVAVADTMAERMKGLMFQKSLPPDEGMIFVFNKEIIAPFWMENTLIPLDIIWIDKNFKIVFIKENAPPLNRNFIIPDQAAYYVLELNAGMIKKTGLQIDETIKLIL